jgi:hypothetical protein
MDRKIIDKIVDQTLPHCSEAVKFDQSFLLDERLKADPRFKEFLRRWRALESWERFIVRPFYGKFHRRFTVEAKACADRVMDKLNQFN